MQAAFSPLTRITGVFSSTSCQLRAISSRFVRGVFHSCRNNDLLRYLLIDGRDVIAMAVMKDADDSRVGAIDCADNSSFSATIWPDRADLDEHAISVHRSADGGWRNENVTCKVGFQPVIE